MKKLIRWTNGLTRNASRGNARCNSSASRYCSLRVETLERRELLAAMGMTVNGGLDFTNLRQVTATFENVSPEALTVQFAFNGFNYGTPQPFGTTKEVTLPNYVGRNYVNALVHFADGSQRMVWDSIDYAVPTLQINNDAAATNFRDVALLFGQVAPDAEEVRFAYNGFNWKAPVEFATSRTVTLPNYEGTNYVNAQIIYAGGKTRTVWDKIDYRVPTVQIDAGAPQTHSRDVTLSFANIVETPNHVQLAFNGFNFGPLASFQTTVDATLPNWDGINYANAKLHYVDGRERVIYDSIDYSPAVVVQACGECVSFKLHVKDSPNEGFRDAQTGNDRVAAFAHAMEIWSGLLDASYPGEMIVVAAQMNVLAPNILGEADASDFTAIGNHVFVDALANHIAGFDVHPATAEFEATFNSTFSWYYGLDGNPGQKRDLVTTVLHEIGHGLNFYDGIASDGSLSFLANGSPAPMIYDTFLVDASGNSLTSMTASQRAASIRSGALYWSGLNGTTANGGIRPKLYAPSSYAPGSSVSHLDETAHELELMSPTYSGSDHTVSPFELAMLEDMGWNLRSGTSSAIASIDTAEVSTVSGMSLLTNVASGHDATVGEVAPLSLSTHSRTFDFGPPENSERSGLASTANTGFQADRPRWRVAIGANPPSVAAPPDDFRLDVDALYHDKGSLDAAFATLGTELLQQLAASHAVS